MYLNETVEFVGVTTSTLLTILCTGKGPRDLDTGLEEVEEQVWRE